MKPHAKPHAKKKKAHAKRTTSLGAEALRVASAKRGAPYRYGGSGPGGFDCSGLTAYAYKSVGKKLPRTAVGQYNSTRRVPASARRPGDLVFFGAGRGVYHVGMYAGNGKVLHSPKAGSVVRLDPIWSRDVSYGRV
ncbi:C40 family peptidase [Streptomyces sp. 7N604]|uniref:C40 family peptidase n=1 Tax=Streptomyces sp. 7N604 TaxID=3457415 RepID=UPI003FCF2E9D